MRFYMDKSVLLMYNTDMNTIVNVEKSADFYQKEACRYYEIFVPLIGNNERSEKAGIVKVADAHTVFGYGDVLIVPPHTEREIYIEAKDTLRILMDGALLPFSAVTTVCELPDGNVRNAVEQAYDFYVSGFKKKSSVLAALGSLIVSLLTLNAGEYERVSPVTVKIRNDIEANLSDSAFTVEDYLKTLPLSSDYVRKLFKRETGLSPHDYLKNARMERAAQLLASGQTNRYSFYTVAQIADLCGFNDAMYFSKTFKRYFGVAPSDYCK